MAGESEPPERLFLSRWSRRKHEAARATTKAAPAASTVPADAAQSPAASPSPAAAATPLVEAAPTPLPSVESLTIDSDFSVFMQPDVAADVKRAAMQKLFADPRFNVMDGLDVYIDDYTMPDPMPAGMLDKLKDVYRTLTEDEEAKADATAKASPAEAADATPATLEPSAPAHSAVDLPAAPPPAAAAETKG